MKKYIAFFRLRFAMGLQYRTAAVAGMVTQFAWGFMEIMVYRAFYKADASAFPMSFSATVSYIWLQQAFLMFFGAWILENEIFDSIMNGNISYELCRPIRLYDMWFARNSANRLAKSLLRCFPILIVAAFLPEPFGYHAPANLPCFLLFVLTMMLGLGVMVAFCMILYALTFFTISPQGLRMFFLSAMDFLTGSIIPIPFLPQKIRTIMEWLPFASMQNVPLRIYSGSMTAHEMTKAVLLQIFWLFVLVAIGKSICAIAERKVAIQGG